MYLEFREIEREDWFIARQLFGSARCTVRHENIEMIFEPGIYVADSWSSMCP
jgi:hypothetical protein